MKPLLILLLLLFLLYTFRRNGSI